MTLDDIEVVEILYDQDQFVIAKVIEWYPQRHEESRAFIMDGDIIVGSMCLDRFQISDDDMKAHSISDFSIYEKYQRQGQGQRFVEFVRDRLHVKQILVVDDNFPAIRLYERCGYVKSNKVAGEGRSVLWRMLKA